MPPERFPGPIREPRHPITLPPDLAEFLAEQSDYCCLPHASDAGTLYIVKAPVSALLRMPTQVPIRIHHELFAPPTAPVIRTVIRIYDQALTPMAFEMFANIADDQQHHDFAELGRQPKLQFAFYDEALQHRRTKVVANSEREGIEAILDRATALQAAIPPDQFDFAAAKSLVMMRTHL